MTQIEIYIKNRNEIDERKNGSLKKFIRYENQYEFVIKDLKLNKRYLIDENIEYKSIYGKMNIPFRSIGSEEIFTPEFVFIGINSYKKPHINNKSWSKNSLNIEKYYNEKLEPENVRNFSVIYIEQNIIDSIYESIKNSTSKQSIYILTEGKINFFEQKNDGVFFPNSEDLLEPINFVECLEIDTGIKKEKCRIWSTKIIEIRLSTDEHENSDYESKNSIFLNNIKDSQKIEHLNEIKNSLQKIHMGLDHNAKNINLEFNNFIEYLKKIDEKFYIFLYHFENLGKRKFIIKYEYIIIFILLLIITFKK